MVPLKSISQTVDTASTDYHPPERISEHIEWDIDNGISVHNPEFDRGIEQFGEDYVQAYVDKASRYAAENVVKAYAAHDLKLYGEISPHFAEVYKILFPVSDKAAKRAGDGDEYALIEHDILDEGIDTIRDQLGADIDDVREQLRPYGEVIEPYDDVRYSDDTPTTEDLRKNSGWNRVREGYTIVEKELDLPPHTFFKDTAIGSFRDERTIAFKHHSAAKESSDRGSALNRESEQLMRRYMKRGEISKYSHLTDDDDLLDALGDLFLIVVEEHDRGEHGEEEWQRNLENMTTYYGALLSDMAANTYGFPEAEPVAEAYRSRLEERVPDSEKSLQRAI